MKTLDAMKVMKEIEEGAENNVQDLRFLKTVEIGQGYRQGDISVLRVADNHPRGKKLGHRKLAIGQGEGSNHFAEGDIELYEGTTVPSFVERGTFLGPVIVAPKGFKNTHPKHAWCEVLQGGVFQVLHQMNVRTLQRAKD